MSLGITEKLDVIGTVPCFPSEWSNKNCKL